MGREVGNAAAAAEAVAAGVAYLGHALFGTQSTAGRFSGIQPLITRRDVQWYSRSEMNTCRNTAGNDAAAVESLSSDVMDKFVVLIQGGKHTVRARPQ